MIGKLPWRDGLLLVLVWIPFWLTYSYLVLNYVRLLPPEESANNPLRHTGPALLYGAAAMGMAAALAITIWLRIRTQWFANLRLFWRAAIEVIHAILYTCTWVLLVEILNAVLFSGFSLWHTLTTFTELVENMQYRSGRFFNGLFVYSVSSAVIYARKFSAAERVALLRLKKIELQATQAKLEALSQQLHPHFLFNALNVISELMHKDIQRADQCIIQLSRLLRRFIEEDRQQCPLTEELDIIRDYLAIETVRYPDRLRLVTEIDTAVGELSVPVFSLHTLVENAVKHAVAKSTQPVTITIRATKVRHKNLQYLHLAVLDDGPSVATHSSIGIGLQNLRERLKTLYGSRARFTAGGRESGGFMANVRLPIQAPPPGHN